MPSGMAMGKIGTGAGMSNKINYYWRFAATGTCFAVFGVGGLLLSIIAFPPLLVFSKKNRKNYARGIIQKSFRLFLWFMEAVGIMRLEIIGKEKLRNCGRSLVIANHPTLIDVVAIVSLVPAASCVVKRSMWKNPFLGGVVRSANYISNLEPDDLITDCAKDLTDGNSLLIFPEGTRSKPGKPLHFVRGTAHIALATGAPILPLVIRCNPSTLTKSEKWYQIPPRRFHLQIEVLDPILVNDWVNPDETQTIAARKLTHALENFYNLKLEHYGKTEA
jgi:1-acyl-sn-glycerol-3-phosphate acyltransferase